MTLFNEGYTFRQTSIYIINKIVHVYQSNLQCGLLYSDNVNNNNNTYLHAPVTDAHAHAHAYIHASAFTRASLYNYKQASFKYRFRNIDQ